ncbi:MAG: zinc ribbon domain-containing protein [Cyanobacteria bacterium J06638_28]
MPFCDRCKNPVKPADLVCPHCGLQLKAHGHPSIELYQTLGEDVLCESCLYHQDDSCTFPQRPLAKSCTLYQSIHASREEADLPRPAMSSSFSASMFWQRYKVWVILGAIFGISFLLTVF